MLVDRGQAARRPCPRWRRRPATRPAAAGPAPRAATRRPPRSRSAWQLHENVVGPPGGLVTENVPSCASTRRRMPISPDPPPSSAPPCPSSVIRSSSRPAWRADRHRGPRWPRCAGRRWSAPRRRRSRRWPRPRPRTATPSARRRGTAPRNSRPGRSSAPASPRSSSTGGSIPRATPRSSVSACSAAVWACSSNAFTWAGSRSLARRAAPSNTVTATSRFCVPSCNERSIRRSSVACASSAAARVAVSCGDAQRQVGPGVRRQQPAAGCGLPPGHGRSGPHRDGDPGQPEQADGDRAGPVEHGPEPQRRSRRDPRHQPPPQRERDVAHREQRQQDGDEAENEPERGVRGQPAQLAPHRRVEGVAKFRPSRLGPDDLRTPPAEPGAFPLGQGLHQPQRHRRHQQTETGHGRQRGDDHQDEDEQREERGAQPAQELLEGDQRGPGRPGDDDAPSAAPVADPGRALVRHRHLR